MTAKEANLAWLSDPEVFAVNRKKAHSDHVYYTNLKETMEEADMPLREHRRPL